MADQKEETEAETEEVASRVTLSDEQKEAIKEHFEGVTDEDLEGEDNYEVIRNIVKRTNKPQSEVQEEINKL